MLRVRRVDFRLTRRSLEKADRRRFEHHARSADDAEMERPGRTAAHNSAIEPRCGGLANGKELTIKIQMIHSRNWCRRQTMSAKPASMKASNRSLPASAFTAFLQNLQVRHAETKNVCEKAICSRI